MATPSDNPPDQSPPNPVSQVAEQTNGDNQDANVAATEETSPTSVFRNTEPIREEQVKNAVNFLSHPRVKGSPVMYRRSFLEKKGLTKEEIDEAFRRVPDPTPTVSAAQPVASTQDGQVKTSPNMQSQPPTQMVQATPVGHVGNTSKMGMLSRLSWSECLLAIGFLAASGAGTAVLLKKSIIPRLKSWIRKVVNEEDEEEGLLKARNKKPSIAEEAAAAAKSAAAAAADVAQASRAMLMTKSEENRLLEELVSMVNSQVHEMKTMSNAIQKLEIGQSMKHIALEERYDQRASATSSRQFYANGKADTDSRSVRSLSPPAPVEPSGPPHPKSYTEIMAMVQRGEKPSNIREISDAPPNPNQPVSNPRVAPRQKPWEPKPVQYSSTDTTESSNGINYEYLDNPSNGGGAAPWYQRPNPRITELESGDEQKFGSSSVVSNARPIQGSWVPPQPPPVMMAEAAAAIRQPKKPAYQQEQMTDDQLLARATSGSTDELQRITKISESGGTVEPNGESSGLYSSETQQEQNGSYVEA